MPIPLAEKSSPAKKPQGTSFATELSSVPITKQRPVHIPSSSSALSHPGVPRANLAVTADAPHGTTQDSYDAKHAHQTVLQQHCTYWDPDNDGIIWPYDTYLGCRKWGWAIPLAVLAVLIIHGGLSYMTVPGLLPDPFFRIYLARIHKDKHGSDSGTYDTEGRFRGQNFEDVFAKYDRGQKGGLTTGDIWRLLGGQRVVFDPFGWSAAAFEWYALYLLVWPADGIMRKEDVRASFDGSLFYKKAEEYAARKKRVS